MDSFRQPHWVADAVREMLTSSAVQISGIVLNGTAEPWAPPPIRRRLPQRLLNAWRKRDAVLLDRYLRFDARRYPSKGQDPFEPTDLSADLAAVPYITAQPRQTRYSDFFDDAALAFVRSLAPDVAVRFGFRILRGPVLSIPRHGVWSFHHDDNRELRGGPAGLWEVLLGWPSTGAVLQRLSEDLDAGATLARTWIATNMISVNQNRIALYRAAAPLLAHKLRELHRRGPAALALRPGESGFQPYSDRLYIAPTMAELLGGLLGVLRRLVVRKIADMRMYEQWQLLFGFDARQTDENLIPQSSMFRLTSIVPPSDRFWADPFPVKHDGRFFVFFEELVYAENKGRIVVAEFTAEGMIGVPRVVLECDFHLSYPFVFQHAGSWYMMPEMGEQGVQDVFRATSFPDQWERHDTLQFGRIIVDPTLHFDGVRWWLFVGTAPAPGSTCDELSLYHSDSPLGPWTPHVGNPVVSDARGARPAGRLFRVGDDLIRPAQDCTPAYGTAISFKRVLCLDTESYREEQIGRIDPDWAPVIAGTHTINAAGPLTVIDGRMRRRR
ncbi:MAG: hypothetical protein H7099_10565 [Gemmatimonadaceae bacterium]|nr:hypothetical protein [Gemmatimonadaceae bacterium]